MVFERRMPKAQDTAVRQHGTAGKPLAARQTLVLSGEGFAQCNHARFRYRQRTPSVTCVTAALQVMPLFLQVTRVVLPHSGFTPLPLRDVG